MTRGAASSTQFGRKPSVAYASERAARRNIEAKLEVLQAALKTASAEGGVASVDLPVSRSAFNRWTPSNLTNQRLEANSKETLKKHADLAKSVDDATRLVRELSSAESAGRVPTPKEARLAAARRSQKIHWNLRVIAERALAVARRDASDLRDRLQSLQAELKSLKGEFAGQLIRLREENTSLRSEVQKLRAAKPRGSGLRSVK